MVQIMSGRSFDYIIVGSGPAGCVLASRLTEDPAVRVLLVEAGGSDRRLIVRMPAAVPYAYMSRALNWGFQSGPEPHLEGRWIDEKRGRVLGGTSSINAMIFNRGNPLDFDGWADQGLRDWSFGACLPYFRRMETFSEGGSDWRGDSGPLKVSRCEAKHPVYDAFLRAGAAAGHAIAADHNAASQEGLHIAQAYIHDGLRQSAAEAYLRPVWGRRNLVYQNHATATRVKLSNKRAVGVEIAGPGGTDLVEAEREVILCSGAFGSPQLLMLSGIGDGAELRSFGIAATHDNPAVGRGLENHPGVNIQYASPYEGSLVSALGPLGRTRIGVEWLVSGDGLGASNFFEAGAFLRTRSDVAWPNMQFEFLPLVRYVENGKLKARPGFQFWMDLSRPLSRGRVALRSANPLDHPSIVFNHLEAPEDLADLVDGVRLARDMIARPALDPFRLEELAPGPDVANDDEIRRWIVCNLGSSYHPSGTCRMGLGEGSVVDAAGRVHGVEALRVVDASIMPRTVTGNLSAAVYMMAEKIADNIRERAALPLEDPRLLTAA